MTDGACREPGELTERLGKLDSGAVTAVAISQDHTFIAVGHAQGTIHLYALAKPDRPARSVLPTTLALVQTGRKEGHLHGSRILHLGFVGARHTAIVSSDETGLAFSHSLGKLLMLASTDIIRMLGRYPAAAEEEPLSTRTKRSSTILDMAALPLGPMPHASDQYALVALLTPSKLVLVGLKPQPRTWWRATPASGAAAGPVVQGVVAWYPSAPHAPALPRQGVQASAAESGQDPVLAFTWGETIRLVQVRQVVREGSETLEFVEMAGWSGDEAVLALQWYTPRVRRLSEPLLDCFTD